MQNATNTTSSPAQVCRRLDVVVSFGREIVESFVEYVLRFGSQRRGGQRPSPATASPPPHLHNPLNGDFHGHTCDLLNNLLHWDVHFHLSRSQGLTARAGPPTLPTLPTPPSLPLLCSLVYHRPACGHTLNSTGGGEISPGENFAGKISPLRKVAKFSPGEILA